MATEILMPALSPTMTQGKLARWVKKEGDTIKSGDVIAEIETDKATMEMEAVDEGVLGRILVPEGTEGVAVNKPIAVLVAEGEKVPSGGQAPAPKPAETPPPKPPAAQAPAVPAASAPQPQAPAAPPPQQPQQPQAPAPQQQAASPPSSAPVQEGERTFASPLARRVAAAANVNIANISGSGPHGRVIKADVEKAMASPAPQAQALAAPAAPAPKPAGPQAAPQPAAATTDLGQPYHAVRNSMMRKVIAKRLLEAKTTIPHFYLTIDCVIDDLMKLRAELNGRPGADYKISVNDFVIRASALALRKVPNANASWTDEAVRLFDNVDISMAVATPEGLITPVIRRADTKGLAAISNEAKELATKARDKKLKPEEYQGGGFTISNLGMFGIKEFSAIINPPQVAILAVGKAEQRPVVKNGALAIATVMSCTLSCDHRVVDGAVGAEFLQAYQALIEDPLKMLL
jgi:pyruvate dehydrogenase E2 component (dihydrolipoamide acetyltransferase)